MSDVLDEKLDRVLDKLIEGGKFIGSKEFLIYITEHFDPEHDKSPMQARKRLAHRAIKQAFIDAGWQPPLSQNEVYQKFLKAAQKIEDYQPTSTTLMNGEYWFDRFEKELNACSHYVRSMFRQDYPGATVADEREMFIKLDVLEAARRVSGLSKGE